MRGIEMRGFAGFVMTYERAAIVEKTIDALLSQTISPEKILIVDNSFSNDTEEVIRKLNNPKVVYYRVGYNSGPAGASALGLKILAEEGFDWIYWGDDDDPPIFNDVFEILLKVALDNPSCGCVGSVGQFFNKKTGFIKRVPDTVLQSDGTLKVDNIAGGMSKIVNGKMILKDTILPITKLFFGFEELDFDLRVGQKGYPLLVDKALYLRHRKNAGKINFKRTYLAKKETSLLWRNYYSVRNLLFVCYNNKLFSALIIQLLKAVIKPFLDVKHGFSYFKKSFYISYLALFHFFVGKYGFRKTM